jgi:hypothetical protein
MDFVRLGNGHLLSLGSLLQGWKACGRTQGKSLRTFLSSPAEDQELAREEAAFWLSSSQGSRISTVRLSFNLSPPANSSLCPTSPSVATSSLLSPH